MIIDEEKKKNVDIEGVLENRNEEEMSLRNKGIFSTTIDAHSGALFSVVESSLTSLVLLENMNIIEEEMDTTQVALPSTVIFGAAMAGSQQLFLNVSTNSAAGSGDYITVVESFYDKGRMSQSVKLGSQSHFSCCIPAIYVPVQRKEMAGCTNMPPYGQQSRVSTVHSGHTVGFSQYLENRANN